MIDEAHLLARAARWDISEIEFAATIARARSSRFGDQPPSAQAEAAWLNKLHLNDLALARACELGRDGAWRHFINTFRPALYRAARTLAGNESQASELADTLWADLYGINSTKGERRSLLAYYHGRSSLTGWLRAVLAQRHIDLKRAERRTLPLQDDLAERIPDPHPGPSTIDPDRGRLLRLFLDVLLALLSGLAPDDRLRLSLYYVEEQTLAKVGALFGEHESTVSRKLERLRQRLRRDVERALRREHGFDNDQVNACFEYALGDWGFDLSRALGRQETPSPSFNQGRGNR